MIKPGLVSVTLRKLKPIQIIDLCVRADLGAIEWGGDVHVPHGDLSRAFEVADLTFSAGLKVSSYGSYYRAGISESEGLRFCSVLDTAVALGAPTIRVWAGNRNYADSDERLIAQVISDTMRIAEMAAKAGLTLTFEFHGGTLTDTNEGAIKFASMIEHSAVYFSWQPPQGYSTEYCLAGLEALLPRLNTIHVFYWTLSSEGGYQRHPLASGIERWRKYFNLIGRTGRDHFVLLEFVKDDSPEQVIEDAATLRNLICG